MYKGKIPCQLHPNQTLTAVCLARHCDRRPLCPMCFHVVQSHSKYVIPIDSLNHADVIQRINEAKERDMEDLNLFQNLDKEIDSVCDKVISTCIRVINQQRNIMKERLNENMNMSKPSDWEELILKVSERHEKCNKKEPGLKEINKYAKSVAKAEHKIRKEKTESKDRRGKLLFYHDEVNSLMKQLETCIGSLENTFSKKFEIEKSISDFAGEKLHLDKQVVTKYETSGHSIEFIESKGMIAIGDINGNLSFYDSKDFRLKCQKRAQKSWITNIKYLPQSDLLVTASQSQELKTFKISSRGTPIMIKSIKYTQPIYSLMSIPHLNLLLTAGKGTGIVMIDSRTLATKGTINTGPHKGIGFEMLYIPKFEVIAVHFYSGYLCIFDINTKEILASIKTGQPQSVNALAFLQAKDLILTAGSGSVKFWKLKYEESSIEFVREVLFPEGSEGNALIPLSTEREILCSFSTNKIFSLGMTDGELKELKKIEANSSFLKVVPKNRWLIVGLYKNKILIYKY